MRKKNQNPERKRKFGSFIFYTLFYLVLAGIFLFKPFISSLLVNNIIFFAFTLIYLIYGAVFFFKRSKKGAPEISLSFEDSNSELQSDILEARDSLKEMAGLYSKIKNREMKSQINELMLISDKIIQASKKDKNAGADAKKFFNYYLPTTIKLLKAYLNIEEHELKGEYSTKSKENIENMLNTAIGAYRKQLDMLFENQAIDIDAEISVMNNMLRREGLINSDFQDIIRAEKDSIDENKEVKEQINENITLTLGQK